LQSFIRGQKERTMRQQLFHPVLWGIAFVIGAAAPVFAQTEGAISGGVTAQADGSVVSGAVVELQSAALATLLEATTSGDGHFAFTRLVPGDYVLTVGHASFQEKRFRLSLEPREVQNIHVALALKPVQEAVDVIAYGTPVSFHFFLRYRPIGERPHAVH
jgi:carboxypeptidase family protein